MVDNKGQTSAEFILLVGGIIVVVLLTLMFYRNYITGLSGEIKGEEVSKDIELIESNLKPLFVANKLSYDNFISLYINDFLVHYDTYNLLNKSKDLKNNNLSDA